MIGWLKVEGEGVEEREITVVGLLTVVRDGVEGFAFGSSTDKEVEGVRVGYFSQRRRVVKMRNTRLVRREGRPKREVVGGLIIGTEVKETTSLVLGSFFFRVSTVRN